MRATPRTALAVVVAVIALTLSAGAGATAARLITGKDIKNGTVTSKDIKNGTVSSKDVRNKSLKVKDFSGRTRTKLTGATGATGPRGATGATGPQGPAGVSGFEVVTRTVSIPGLGGTETVAAACPAGKKAISATAGYAAPLENLLSEVSCTADDAFSASGLNLLVLPHTLTLDVVCATIPD